MSDLLSSSSRPLESMSHSAPETDREHQTANAADDASVRFGGVRRVVVVGV